MDGQTNTWIEGSMGVLINGWVGGWVGGWTNRSVDKWTIWWIY